MYNNPHNIDSPWYTNNNRNNNNNRRPPQTDTYNRNQINSAGQYFGDLQAALDLNQDEQNLQKALKMSLENDQKNKKKGEEHQKENIPEKKQNWKKFNEDEMTKALLDSYTTQRTDNDKRNKEVAEKRQPLPNKAPQHSKDEEEEVNLAISESLQSFSISNDKEKNNQNNNINIHYPENEDEDAELQRALNESLQRPPVPKESPFLSSIPTFPAVQPQEQPVDEDMEAAILMSMGHFNPKKNENLEKKEQNYPQIQPQIEEMPKTEVYSDSQNQTMDDSMEISGVIEEQMKMEEEKRQLNERRLHVREQDDAYETSVAIDRSKADYLKELAKTEQKKKEEQKRQEELKLKEKNERERNLKNLEMSLPVEPESANPNALHITFRLPNGDRFSRFFLKTTTLKQVKDFVDSQELHGKSIPLSYNLITDFPKLIWNNLALMLSETNFQKRQLLRIEPNEN